MQIRTALQNIEDIAPGFDRLTIWIDHPSPDLPVEDIRKHCGNISVMPCKSVKYHNVWQTQIELFQPSSTALKALRNTTGHRYRTKLSYAEIALDWITSDEAQARELWTFFVTHFKLQSSRHHVQFFGDTAYYKPRSVEQSGRNACNLVVYPDRPSKLNVPNTVGKPCCHLEYRLSHPAMIGKVASLFTVADCVAFDHQRFWQQHLTLFEIPSKADLGRILQRNKAHTSEAAHRKRAATFLDKRTHDGIYALQDCVLDFEVVSRILKPIDNHHFLKTQPKSDEGP
ncbi:hypothetical protein PQR25_36770 [Paraburkholderia nemoris]|uniref:hypothetical protein n=1 Tax=Paraburkholderia nemoris TaxID=2793076 RepID=UPI0038BB991A